MAQGSDTAASSSSSPGQGGPSTAWRGRSGRTYRLAEGGELRRGSKATVRPVIAEGSPLDPEGVAAGTKLALKLPWKGNPDAPDALDREAALLRTLGEGNRAAPCPRLVDVLGEDRPNQGGRLRVTGLVLEWCSHHMESWWTAAVSEADAFARLCEALAEICVRVSEYHALAAARFPDPASRPTARIKPRNLVLGSASRWILADFEEVRVGTLYDEHLSMTQPLLGGENFLAPEILFGANRSVPAAVDTWSLGCSFYALLRLRSYLRSGALLPAEGTNSPHFRTHRMHLVIDLHTRKPALGFGQDLDPTQFHYPDRLPDQDRRALMAALDGIFGASDALLEGQLARDIVRVLDRSLQIDPARRYGDPLDMARDFQTLAARFRELANLTRKPDAEDGQSDEATQIMAVATFDVSDGASSSAVASPEEEGPVAPPPVVPPVNLRALRPSPEPRAEREPVLPEPRAEREPVRSEPARPEPVRPPPEAVADTMPAVHTGAAVAAALVENRLGALERRLSDLSELVRRPPPTPIPPWIYVALGALALLQVLQVGVLVMLALSP